jgi:hypothetical protein
MATTRSGAGAAAGGALVCERSLGGAVRVSAGAGAGSDGLRSHAHPHAAKPIAAAQVRT